MIDLIRMLTEAGAPEFVLEAAADAQDAAALGDIRPLLDFFTSIGLDPNQITDGKGAGERASSEHPCDAFPMSSPKAATLLTGESADRTHEEEIKFLESILAIDPESVEAMINIGIESDDASAVKYFHQACEIGTKRVEKSHELIPCWIDYRNQMGVELVERARLADAIEILLPAIDEDERDGAGTRFFIIDLMLRLGWWDELGELLERFPDDGMGPGIFAKAIRLQHLQPGCKEAVDALKEAHESKPLVLPILISTAPLPAESPAHYAVFSREEAFVIIRYLKPGLRANPGMTRWIRDTLGISADDQRGAPDEWADVESEPAELRPGDLGIALELPQSDEVWTYHGQKVRSGNYLGLVLCDDEPVSFESFDAAPKSRELRQFILDAVCQPIIGGARRPKQIRVANKATLKTLKKTVGTYGVACDCVKPSAFQKSVMKELAEQADRGLEMMAESEAFEPADFDIDQISQTDSPWFVAVLQPPMWIGDQSTPYRPYMQLVVDGENGTVLKSEISENYPTAQRQVEVVADAMIRPMVGDPRCPGAIALHPQIDQAAFEGAMVELTSSDRVEIGPGDEPIASLFESMVMDMIRSNDPIGTAMIEQDGIDSELLRRLYQAAARFYRVAPWNLVGGDQLVRVTSGSTPGHDWAAGVMGQMGQAMGLSIINGIEVARSMIREDCDLNDLSAISVQFDEAFDIPPLELWQIETQNYEIANEEAYPLFMKIENGDGRYALNADEIRTAIDVLNHLPAFLRQNRTQKATTHGVPGTASHLELQWIDG